ncbi:hypothetical protein [Luteimonas saliphila]|uniref:hypothetical protein n=1 Tax=Luteimonas saliphila TaxID=2804919 RepID=UPI00192E2EB9|nr:hypothetical protein [Luteimonas saliphila]
MGRTSELRNELKRAFFPFAESHGFLIDRRDEPTFTTFRRIVAGSLHVFDVQWDKYDRPRFVVNFGICPASGLHLSGKDVPPDQVLAGWTPRGGRLQPRPGASEASWFRQDRPLLARLFLGAALRPAPEVVAQPTRLFPELEAYWSTGTVGKHVRVTRHAV